MNLIKLDKVISHISPGRKAAFIMTVSGRLIDHTSMEYCTISRSNASTPATPAASEDLRTFTRFRATPCPPA
jgi:hypothetical protein